MQLDSDLNRIHRAAAQILYGQQIALIPTALAENENLQLDFAVLLANTDIERRLNPGRTAVENQAAVMRLRTELVQSLVLARNGQDAAAVSYFEGGAAFYFRQLQRFVDEVAPVMDEYVDARNEELRQLRGWLGGLLVALTLSVLALLLIALRRVVIAAEVEREGQAGLLRQQRLATLGQIAGTIGHELRNPLATIHTSVFSLENKLSDKNLGTEKALLRMKRSVERCDAIVGGLLQAGKRVQVDKVPTSLNDWLNDVLQDLEVPAGITILAQVEDVGDVDVDPETLRRAVINVYNNACQAMTETGEAGVSPAAHGGTLQISLRAGGQRVAVEFEDTGIGIAPEHMDQLFEPLFTTKSHGIGLGMSVIKQIMEDHGGGVEVSSQLNSGTQVTLWLPTAAAVGGEV